MGNLAEQIDADVTLDYADVPYLPASTALGHRGLLVCGTLAGTSVVVMDGRVHRYEGHPMQSVTLPVRVMNARGSTC